MGNGHWDVWRTLSHSCFSRPKGVEKYLVSGCNTFIQLGSLRNGMWRMRGRFKHLQCSLWEASWRADALRWSVSGVVLFHGHCRKCKCYFFSNLNHLTLYYVCCLAFFLFPWSLRHCNTQKLCFIFEKHTSETLLAYDPCQRGELGSWHHVRTPPIPTHCGSGLQPGEGSAWGVWGTGWASLFVVSSCCLVQSSPHQVIDVLKQLFFIVVKYI